MEALSTIFQLAIGGGIATIALWLLTDDDMPATGNHVVDTKTLDISGSHVTVETLADGTSRVVAFRDSEFCGEPATRENGRLSPHWQAMQDAGLLQ